MNIFLTDSLKRNINKVNMLVCYLECSQYFSDCRQCSIVF